MDNTIFSDYADVDYLIGIIWALILGFSILLWPINRDERKAILWGWGAKIVVGLGLALVYEAHYGGDAFGYFNVGLVAPIRLDDVHFGNGSDLMLFLSGAMSSFLPSYHAQKMTCAYVGLVAVYNIYAAFRVHRGIDTKFLLGLVLFPSTLFWSSILGKDSLVLLGIALFARATITWQVTESYTSLAYGALGLFLAMAFRFWLAPIMLGSLVVLILTRSRSFWVRGLALTIAIAGFIYSGRHALNEFQIDSADNMLQRTDMMARGWAADGGSGEVVSVDLSNPAGLGIFLPLGMFTALYRPLPGEVLNIFGALASAENVVLLWLTWKAFRHARWKDLSDPLIGWSVGFILIWSAIYGVVSYQNLGTAVRFRLQVFPILLGVIFHLIWPKRKAYADADGTMPLPLLRVRSPLPAR